MSWKLFGKCPFLAPRLHSSPFIKLSENFSKFEEYLLLGYDAV
jgi:hypothetical protein